MERRVDVPFLISRILSIERLGVALTGHILPRRSNLP